MIKSLGSSITPVVLKDGEMVHVSAEQKDGEGPAGDARPLPTGSQASLADRRAHVSESFVAFIEKE